MKAFTLIFILFCALNSSYGQEEPVKAKPEFARFKIGLLVTPEMGYRIITIKKDFADIPYYQEMVKMRNERDTPNLGFSAGVTASYNFSRKVSIEAGLQYANRGYTREDPTNININPETVFDAPYFGKVPVAFIYKYDWNYLELPLRVVFTSGQGKLKFIATAGAAFGFVIRNKTTLLIEYYNGDLEEATNLVTKDFNQFTISPQLSIGADYQISSRFHVRVEPIARHSFLMKTVLPTRTNLISGGLQFSIHFAL
jgi:hypothetical protein